MPQISFAVSNMSYGWSGNCTIPYEITYNQEANTSTISFGQCSFTYFGRANYGTTASADITFTPHDNLAGRKKATFSISGTTNGGSKSFDGYASPSQIVISHGEEDGEKKVIINVTAAVSAYMSSYASRPTEAAGEYNATVMVGIRETTKAVIVINGTPTKATPYVAVQNGSSVVWTKAKAYNGPTKM